jgi:hypothetical protein
MAFVETSYVLKEFPGFVGVQIRGIRIMSGKW